MGPEHEPVHRRACHVVLHLQHDAPYQLAVQRPSRTFPETESNLDRKRPGLDTVFDTAAGSPIRASHVRRAAADQTPKRIHAGNVLHLTATYTLPPSRIGH